MGNDETFIERHILIGLIVSEEYLEEVYEIWNPRLIKSPVARKVSSWCLEYYKTYQEAPGEEIESIYFEKLRKGDIHRDLAEELEEDILPGLSEEYERSDTFNVAYLLDRTQKYFSERNLSLHQDRISGLMQDGEIEEAEDLANQYAPLEKNMDADLDLSEEHTLDRVHKAFSDTAKPIVEYPGAVGEFMNEQLTRDALVAFLAPEKTGKSWIMLDLARRAVSQRLNVAFFQAGDMSEGQQLRRLGIHLARRSDKERYTKTQYQPVKDCKKNQVDTCQKEVREDTFGLSGDAPMSEKEAREELTFPQLTKLHGQNEGYLPCHNCKEYHQAENKYGAPWFKKIDPGSPLGATEAEKIFKEYFIQNNRQFMLSTHPNNTLSMAKIKNHLDRWYRKGFVPDVICLDYADLLTGEAQQYRHEQNEIWKGMRSLSEEYHCLFVTATQSDAASYDQATLNLSNFSEDKRKFAHVTAMFGLNQEPGDREKDIGIMRLNKLVIREGGTKGQVSILQNLKRGQPVLTSYW
jgi:hypothetical protein